VVAADPERKNDGRSEKNVSVKEGDLVEAAFDMLDCSFLKSASDHEPSAVAYAKV
jgi:hypothetical protein